MPDSSTIRAQRTRARQRLGITWEPLLCSGCGDPHRGRHGGKCRKCWLKTPAGRADIRERVNRHRDNKQAQGDPHSVTDHEQTTPTVANGNATGYNMGTGAKEPRTRNLLIPMSLLTKTDIETQIEKIFEDLMDEESEQVEACAEFEFPLSREDAIRQLRAANQRTAEMPPWPPGWIN